MYLVVGIRYKQLVQKRQRIYIYGHVFSVKPSLLILSKYISRYIVNANQH